MAQPLTLADLPLEIWTMGAGTEPRRRGLTPAERAEAVDRIDYVILMDQSFYRDAPRPLEAGLALEGKVLWRLAMAPVQAGAEVLDLRALTFDVLDLTSKHEALGIPLTPGSSGTLWSDPVDPDLVARSLCRHGSAEPDWTCLNAAWR